MHFFSHKIFLCRTYFVLLHPISAILSHRVIRTRPLPHQTKDVHAEPREAMPSVKAGIGWEKLGSLHFVERRLLNASSLQSKLRTLGIHVADVAMVDVLGMCLCASPLEIIDVVSILLICHRGTIIHIRRGLRSCLSKRGGKFEGPDCEISSEYGSHAFLLI